RQERRNERGQCHAPTHVVRQLQQGDLVQPQVLDLGDGVLQVALVVHGDDDAEVADLLPLRAAAVQALDRGRGQEQVDPVRLGGEVQTQHFVVVLDVAQYADDGQLLVEQRRPRGGAFGLARVAAPHAFQGGPVRVAQIHVVGRGPNLLAQLRQGGAFLPVRPPANPLLPGAGRLLSGGDRVLAGGGALLPGDGRLLSGEDRVLAGGGAVLPGDGRGRVVQLAPQHRLDGVALPRR